MENFTLGAIDESCRLYRLRLPSTSSMPAMHGYLLFAWSSAVLVHDFEVYTSFQPLGMLTHIVSVGSVVDVTHAFSKERHSS